MMRLLKKRQRRKNPYNSGSWSEKKVAAINREIREGISTGLDGFKVPNTTAEAELDRYHRWLSGYGEDDE